MIEERIRTYIADPASGEFEELVRQAFAFQVERIEPFRNLCRQRGVEPSTSLDWQEVPVVPALAYKTLELAAEPGGEIFRSSGTTSARRSVHRHGFLDLYRATIEAAFPRAFPVVLEQPSMLSLVPGRDRLPDSSLSFMVDHVVASWGATTSLAAFGLRGVEARKVRSFLAARQRDGQPVLILGTAFALAELLEALERFDLHFRLPTGSLVFETGGYKGRSWQLTREELLVRLDERLAVPVQAVVREYGMTELTSQLYTGAAEGGDPDLFLPPHWVRVRVLDPISLEETTPGSAGLLCVFDLANLSSAIHLLTEDLGVAHGDGIHLIGRAASAELRGCSLTVEELTTGQR